MNELLDQVKAIYNKLEASLASAKAKEALLASKQAELDEKERKLVASQNDVNARQRVLDRAEANIAYADVVKAQLKESKDAVADAQKLMAEVMNEKNALIAKEKSLSEMIEVYKAKTVVVQNKESELEARKKNLRSEILEEMKKSFLK